MMKKDNAEMQPAGYGYGSNAKMPKGADAADANGNRREKVVNGIGMGKADGVGSDMPFDGGRMKGVCYTHERKSYQK
jgi:hypothetical protein